MGVVMLTSIVQIPMTARAADYASEYTVSIGGFRVGKSQFSTTIENRSYTIQGTVKAAGVARLFSSITGSLTAIGTISSDKVTARSFDVKYTEGEDTKRTTLSFSGGDISAFVNDPKTRKRGQWIELQDQHLKQVLDPIAAILVPAKTLRSVCSNTQKVFDGAMRADFPMRYVRTIPFSTRGYKGDAVTCRAKFKPVAGYNKSKKDIRWMRDEGFIDISFAPIGSTGIFAPVAAKVKTRLGTATIRAKRFETLTK